ncbi:MAG: PolC-type DNA polymerase III, partial [Clostridia bacterium]|nr:PolC-type DNA polymerase III [Clostridia bacterium]
MNEFLNAKIDWDKLSITGIEKSEYRYNVDGISMNKETLVLVVRMTLNFIIPFNNLETIREDLKKNLPDVSDVRFEFTYKDVIIDIKDIVRLYVPYMIKILNGDYQGFTKSIDLSGFRLNDRSLTLKAFGNTAANLLNANVKPLFESLLRDTFDVKLDITFVNDSERYTEKEKSFNEEEANDLKEKVDAQKQLLKEKAVPKQEKKEDTGAPYRRKKREDIPMEGNRIMGGGVGAPKDTELTEVYDEKRMGKCVVEGQVFRTDKRQIKTGNFIYSALVTDGKTTVLCKAFVTEAKLADLESTVSEGKYVRLSGEIQFDTFENMKVIMFRALELIDEPEQRMDTCERKRVELHLHTKMSQMDGLTDAKAAVKRAAKWGQPAIAITDHGVVQSFPDAFAEAEKQKKNGRTIKVIYGMEGYVFDDAKVTDSDGVMHYKDCRTYHIIILAKSQIGIKNLYKLVSYSHVNYYHKNPRIPWSLIESHREGLIIGSACEAGEVFSSVIGSEFYSKRKKEWEVYAEASPEEQERIASRYDYLEIQPLINNRFLTRESETKKFTFHGKRIENEEDLKAINRRIIEIADKLGKKVVATTDSHYENSEDALYRNILMAGMGFEDAEEGEGLFMRTTDEMLQEFSYLGDRAEEIVVDNTQYIADLCEEGLKPVPVGKFPPKIANAEETLRTSCMKKAYEMYGNPLPEEIASRLETELNSIIGNGYAVMYVSAQMLVNKSLSDGYLVGSRGSVGSSLAATMADITEVNPLDPHYYCTKCHYIEWGDKAVYDCGVDMPPKKCPVCGEELNRDGYMIPFATFLGFSGNKEPDIDLNFAGEYQPVAHRYVGEIFGEKNVFKAGTVSGIQDKTAYGYVKKFYEEKGQTVNKYEIERLVAGCTGVKRTTGQHPGGIVIVPDDHEIYEFCPVQHPANDAESDVITTHFDYHKIDQNLLKLDILGHDIPSMIRQLQDMTGVDPLKIDLTDRKVLSIFNGNEALDILDPEYDDTHGSFALPEFGTKCTQQMLDDIKPDKFADLVRRAGFSHGTDVWLNNAQDYIRQGIAKMNEVISTRDDIMNYLMIKGLEPGDAFTIMEIVRKKNKSLGDDHIKLMKDHGVPDWYIDSCRKIQYMFPRAHAVAYTMMSFRMAWFKVYYPREFYATYFTTKVSDFDAATILKGRDAVLNRLKELNEAGNSISAKEDNQKTILEVAKEMYA